MLQFELVLFDVDGTLLQQGGVVQFGIGQALKHVYGTSGPIKNYRMSGKTDPQIMKELMLLHGLEEGEIDEKINICCDMYVEVLENTISDFNIIACHGVHRLLEALSTDNNVTLGLLTGNLEGIVGHKLKQTGLPREIFKFGAFGSDDANRNNLPNIAISRAEKILNKSIDKKAVLIIGDTPYDIACAKHGNVKVLAVATGSYSLEELAIQEPDFAFNDLSDTNQVLKIIKG